MKDHGGSFTEEYDDDEDVYYFNGLPLPASAPPVNDVRYEVSFADGEQQADTWHGYARHPVSVRDLTYDGTSHRFSFRLAPGHSGTAVILR